jgi:hypothetical protein
MLTVSFAAVPCEVPDPYVMEKDWFDPLKDEDDDVEKRGMFWQVDVVHCESATYLEPRQPHPQTSNAQSWCSRKGYEVDVGLGTVRKKGDLVQVRRARVEDDIERLGRCASPHSAMRGSRLAKLSGSYSPNADLPSKEASTPMSMSLSSQRCNRPRALLHLTFPPPPHHPSAAPRIFNVSAALPPLASRPA